MAQTIKLKRGTTTPTTSDIVSGEVAVDTSAQKLYINDAGTVKEVGGGGGGGYSEGDTILAGAGTQGAPSFAFDTDTNTGMYRFGADQIGMTSNGSLRAVFGDIIYLNTTDVAMNEKLYHNGDTDTYMQYTANRVRIVAGGVTAFDSDSPPVSQAKATAISLVFG